jgi:hypothetical protein
MKNLILLFLVIGAVVSTETTLTNTAEDNLWKITYVATTTGQFYSFTLSFTTPTTLATNPATIIPVAQYVGVACVPTLSDFVIAVPAVVRGAFFFTAVNDGAGGAGDLATNQANTNWGPLVLTYAPSALYTADSTIDAGKLVRNCALGGGFDAPVIANNVATYTFTVAAACGTIPQMGTAWFGKCFAIKATAVATVPSTADNVVPAADIVGELDVTFPGTTTVCALNGASTFATGATILAGIAYLQF